MNKFWAIVPVIVLGCRFSDVSSVKPAMRHLSSIERSWQSYPDRLQSLMEAIDRKNPGLRSFDIQLTQGDTIGAFQALLDFYRHAGRQWVISTLEEMPVEDADRLVSLLSVDSIQLPEGTGKIPVNDQGGWLWNYTGSSGDDEFGYGLNGHRYLSALWFGKISEDDDKPVSVFDRIIKDWIVQHPLPPDGDSIYLVLDTNIRLDWRDIGEVEWRTLETGNRLGASWCALFYAFQQSEAFSPAARLLMLSSILDQARYLRRYHKSKHNWTTMEMNGLALAGLAFPEFKESVDWADYALRVMMGEINRQVYPDGLQTELSTKTQWVALHRFESVAENFEKAGRPLTEQYLNRVEDMYHYLAYCMRPDGHQPLNNDADREDLTSRVLQAAKKFGRPDWHWIATNGREGTRPGEGPSIVFPWGGICIMRNGWDRQAHWAFFDAGPYGTGHQHRDMLHLSVSAFGKDLLVDGGRYTHQDYFSFDPTIWRGYFRSSFSHNVILIDGHGQKEGPLRTDTPLQENVHYRLDKSYDYITGKFIQGFENVEGDIEHWRSVLYLRDFCWIVLDQIITDQARQIQALWHFAPSCSVGWKDNEVMSTDRGQPNLSIKPLGNFQWKTGQISGQEKPFIQGWYSANYGQKTPSPTAIYTADIEQTAVFAWILHPTRGEPISFEASLEQTHGAVQLDLNIPGEKPVKIRLPLNQSPREVFVDF